MKNEWVTPKVAEFGIKEETKGTWVCRWCGRAFKSKEEYEAHLTRTVYKENGVVGRECPLAPTEPPSTVEEDYTRVS